MRNGIARPWASALILLLQYPTAFAFLCPKLPLQIHSVGGTKTNGDIVLDDECSGSRLSGLSVINGQKRLMERVKEEGITQLVLGVEESFSILSIVSEALFPWTSTPADIVACCDDLDNLEQSGKGDLWFSEILKNLKRRALEFRRYALLAKLQAQDYEAYIATASFLSPSRIPRQELPNVQDIPLPYRKEQSESSPSLVDEHGIPLVPDCGLDDVKYNDSVLDELLLQIFRMLVTKHTGGVTSEKEGIDGLLEQGRTFMLQKGQTPEAQHQMVYNTLKSLMTPFLPPFYRLFMSGIVPKVNSPWDGKQVGPWFYAPALTSFVTPTFFRFLVGPSRPNRRRDGTLGGLVVEKCRFLQESGCKGLCLHQCKLPAQKFFAEELGLPLTVSPNFVTQECQWSFGDEPLPPAQDPSFPAGCLKGCPSRSALVAIVGKSEARKADLSSF